MKTATAFYFWFVGIIFAVPAIAAEHTSEVQVYPAPEGVVENRDYELRVRAPRGEWHRVSIYGVKVDVGDGVRRTTHLASMAYFDFRGVVEIEVRRHGNAPVAALIRPRSLGLAARIEADCVTFTLDQPRSLSIEFDGDITNNLHLFAGPIEALPDREAPNIVYFGPGIHQLPERGLRVASGQTLCFAGGSIIRGRIRCEGVEHVRLLGRGYFDQRESPVLVVDSRDVQIDGLMVSASINIAQSDGVVVRNLKAITYGPWGDGLDVYCSRAVRIERVFLRTSDDCIAVYAHRNRWFGDVRDIAVDGAVLWADVAHPILVGTHGNTARPEILEGLVFRDIDILDHCEAQLDYQGCLSLNASDANLIRNVRFERIRIEDFRRGQLVNLRVAWNRKYAQSPGRGIEQILFKDITYVGTHANLSVIAGYDESRRVSQVVFENLVINGRHITDQMDKPGYFKTADLANIFIGEHVDGVVFR